MKKTMYCHLCKKDTLMDEVAIGIYECPLCKGDIIKNKRGAK